VCFLPSRNQILKYYLNDFCASKKLGRLINNLRKQNTEGNIWFCFYLTLHRNLYGVPQTYLKADKRIKIKKKINSDSQLYSFLTVAEDAAC
jgi:hypothetical protein